LKKLFLLTLFYISLVFFLNACLKVTSNENEQRKVMEGRNTENQSLDVRESVWNQLTIENKKHIEGDWKDASMKKIILSDSNGVIKDKKFIGKEVYLVEYPSNDNPTLGEFGVFADTKSHRLIGYGYRE